MNIYWKRRGLGLMLMAGLAGSARAGEPVPETTREIHVNVPESSGLKLVAGGAFWGGVIGGIVPLAVNLIADKHSWKVGPGIGIGALAGLAWGVHEYSDRRTRHMVSLQDGHLKADMPALVYKRDQDENRLDVKLFASRF